MCQPYSQCSSFYYFRVSGCSIYIISYNEREVRQGGSKDDIRQGYNVWIDLVDPTTPEL